MAVTLRLHPRQYGGDPVQHAADVDVDHPVPFVDLERRERRQRHHASVVDQDVDAAELELGEVHEGVNIIEVDNIERSIADEAAGALDLVRKAFQPVRPSSAKHDACAMLGEHSGGPFADTARSAGDERRPCFR